MKLRNTWFLSAIAADLGERLDFGDRARQRQRRGRLDRGRDDRVGHRVERVVADHAQHLRDLGVVGADVALDERVVVLEFAQGVLGHDGRPGSLGGAVRPAGLTAAGRSRARSSAARKPRSPLCPFA